MFQDGNTPLILASAAGHLDCCLQLLEQGADHGARRTVIILNSIRWILPIDPTEGRVSRAKSCRRMMGSFVNDSNTKLLTSGS